MSVQSVSSVSFGARKTTSEGRRNINDAQRRKTMGKEVLRTAAAEATGETTGSTGTRKGIAAMDRVIQEFSRNYHNHVKGSSGRSVGIKAAREVLVGMLKQGKICLPR